MVKIRSEGHGKKQAPGNVFLGVLLLPLLLPVSAFSPLPVHHELAASVMRHDVLPSGPESTILKKVGWSL